LVSQVKDSLKKRYIYKLFANAFSLVAGFGIQAVVPRALGPKSYGDFNFLTSFFAEVMSFLDMGTSSCFYTKLAKRQKEPGLPVFYLYFSLFIGLIALGFVALAYLTPFYSRIWPGQDMFYTYLAVIFGILTWFAYQVLSNVPDAYGITVYAEKIKIIQKIIAVALIGALFIWGKLNLRNFFYYNYVVLIFIILAFIWIAKYTGHLNIDKLRLPFKETKEYLIEFYRYSHPLFVYSLVGLVAGIFDRWLLQTYGGSIQQGFFGFSYQVWILCFLFSSAMAPLITREFSIAFANKDLAYMSSLFRRYIPLFYSLTAYFSCFVAIQAGKVIYILGGDSYKDALIPLTIMALCPIHHTYGQLSGSVFFATEKTKLYRNIGITSMLVGLPATYLLIAPKLNFGLDMGATGLAIKIAVLQFLAVNAQLYFNAKLLRLSFWKFFLHQIVSLASLLALAFFAKFLIDKMLGAYLGVIPRFLLSGLVYTCAVFFMLYLMPIIFGLKRHDLHKMAQIFYNKIRVKPGGSQ